MQTGQWFNKNDIYANQFDFINELINKKGLRNSTDEIEIYNEVMDSCTTHFEVPTKALAYPMIWSYIIEFCEKRIKQREDLVYPRKYLRIAKHVFFKRQENNNKI